MAKREPRGQNQHLAQFGEICTGPLTGWRYAFLRFVSVREKLYLDLRCTPPGWPFPQDVRFAMHKDKFQLRPVPGERARRLDALALMTAALEHGTTPPLEE